MTKRITKEAAKKAVANHNRRVRRANEAFEKLSAADKRVYIARDVLAQLRSKQIIAERGVWVGDENGSVCVIPDDTNDNAELKDVFNSMESCTACALGGLFFSTVKIADKLKVGSISDQEIDFNDISKYLRQFFSKDQLLLIEIAFEGGSGGCSADEVSNLEDGKAAERFFDQFHCDDEDETDSHHMRLIMENIIANKGKFVPSKRPRLTFVTPGFESVQASI